MASFTEITKVQVIIRRFLWETRDVVKDGESSRKWLENFRNTLQYQDLNDNPEPYAMALLSEARKFNEIQLRKQQIRWVRESLKKEGITDPTKEQIETRWAELYGNDTTADAPTREDGEFKSDSGDAGDLESATSANLYGDAATREGAEVCTNRESGASEPTTISKNIGNDQGTEALEKPRTGGDSVRRVGVASPAVCHKSAGAPVRNSGRRFRNKEEYMQWAIDSGLDAQDASDCWEATLERGGKDKDGNKVNNIKAFATQWCKTRAENRRTA